MRKIAILLIVFSLLLLSRENVQRQEKWESLIPKKKENTSEIEIRVLLMTDNFEDTTHSEIRVSSVQGLIMFYGNKTENVNADEIIQLNAKDKRFADGSIRIVPNGESKMILHHLRRSYGVPYYCGELEIFKTGDKVAIVNQVPLETYLKYVVPSEMPSSYEMEALKAQAICARTYAYAKLQTEAYPEYKAHVDDSTSFQVYGNIENNSRTDRAVKETESEYVWDGDKLANTYFFSTSCGKTTSVAVVNEIGEAYERNLPWYRWNVAINKAEMERILEAYSGKEIGVLQELIVSKIGEGGIVLGIKAIGSEAEMEVMTENKIRRALADKSLSIHRQDGSSVACTNLLPSAFFTIEEEGSSYRIVGGGYGHGTGMSQNGANEMAKSGKTYLEILQFFYPDTKVVSI